MRHDWGATRPVAQEPLDGAERQAGIIGLFGAFCFLVIVVYATLIGRAELDTRIVDAVRTAAEFADPFRANWVESAARDLAGLGGAVVLCLVVIAAVVQVMLTRGWSTALMVLLALSGGVVLLVVLKFTFGRASFGFSPYWLSMFSSSFPSTGAVVPSLFYPTLGAVLSVIYGNRLASIFILTTALLATVLVGLSRILLGIHLPADVLAGWSAGLAWASLCWIVARRTRGWGRLR